MSAPHIPNLNTLRRGGPRSRGRGRGGWAATTSENGAAKYSLARDEVIQQTDNDAATSRLSAVEAGYLNDDFANLLTTGQHTRRLPLMNRGSYARTTAIDKIVETFLDASGPGKKQIISLGAGSDTRFFRLRQKRPHVELIYHELDFAVNTKAKIALLISPAVVETAKRLANFDLRGPDVAIADDGSRLSSRDYCVHPQDLRQLPEIGAALPGIDVSVPTLFISECCLIYLAPEEADRVLNYFSSLFPFASSALCIAIYEPIRPHDAFGRTMVSNLTARGIHLQTLEKYASLSAQRERLTAYGFASGAEAADIDYIWRKWLVNAERERVEGLEWMDEVEEFTLFARHYCVAWGWRGFSQLQQWSALPGQADD